MSPNTSLHFLLNLIVSTYLQTSRCLMVFSKNFDLTVEVAFVRINVAEDCTISSDIVFRDHGCQDIIIETECPREVLENFEELIRKHKERFTFRRFLVVGNGNVKQFQKFFTSDSLRFISDLLFVFPMFTTREKEIKKTITKLGDIVSYELWTHKFTGAGNDYRNPEMLDVWFSENSSFLYNNFLYPDKIYDQMGKTLRVAAFTYLPYSIIGKGK